MRSLRESPIHSQRVILRLSPRLSNRFGDTGLSVSIVSSPFREETRRQPRPEKQPHVPRTHARTMARWLGEQPMSNDATRVVGPGSHSLRQKQALVRPALLACALSSVQSAAMP